MNDPFGTHRAMRQSTSRSLRVSQLTPSALEAEQQIPISSRFPHTHIHLVDVPRSSATPVQWAGRKFDTIRYGGDKSSGYIRPTGRSLGCTFAELGDFDGDTCSTRSSLAVHKHWLIDTSRHRPHWTREIPISMSSRPTKRRRLAQGFVTALAASSGFVGGVEASGSGGSGGGSGGDCIPSGVGTEEKINALFRNGQPLSSSYNSLEVLIMQMCMFI